MPQLRYVILRHDGVDEPHFDLMFETNPGSKLTTWRSPCWPIDQPTQLVQLGEHRRKYLEYEGPVEGNRGQVKQIASGHCSIELSKKGQFWTIQLDESASPLYLSQVKGNEWLAILACG